MKNALVVVALVLFVSPLLAQEEDAEGCKDSTVLSRMKSCRIESCDKKDFDRGNIRTGASDEQMQGVEGEVETTQTVLDPGLGCLHVRLHGSRIDRWLNSKPPRVSLGEDSVETKDELPVTNESEPFRETFDREGHGPHNSPL